MRKRLSAKEQAIHGQFQRYGRNAREWTEKCKRLLPLINECGIWEKKGFSSIHEYAGKLAGMGRSQVNDALRIYRKVEEFPLLGAVVEAKGLGSVRPVLGIINMDSQNFWAEKARIMTKNDLETYVREYRKQETQDNSFLPKSTVRQVERCPRTSNDGTNQVRLPEISVDNVNCGQHIECDERMQPQRLRDNERMRKLRERIEKLKNPNLKLSLLENFVAELEEFDFLGIQIPPPVDSKELEKHLEMCRGGFSLEIKKPEPVASESRYINADITRYIEWRSGCMCEFPGCRHAASEKHHAERWAIHRVHDVDRVWNLCQNHHNLAHYGLIENEEREPESWRLSHGTDRTYRNRWIDSSVQHYRNVLKPI